MKNDHKVLIIGPDAQGGITSVINLHLENGLISIVDFFSTSSEGNNGYKILYFLFFLIKYIYHLIKNKELQLVHIHISTDGSFFRKSIALQIAKLFNKKVILHIHGAEFSVFYVKSPKFVKKLITYTLNKADLILVLSKQWKAKVATLCSNPNIKVLYNPTIIKTPNPVKNSPLKILFMGRLGKRKGVYDIIDAAKQLKTDNVLINLYGDGNLAEFQQLVAENNLQSKVKIMGWVSGEEKEKIIQNSDIYILPSYNEGLPMSILEAMAYGLPIISTPVGGTPEAVEDGVNGFLILPGDTKALAEKIEILANNEPLMEKMGQESYRIAQEKFDIKIIIKQLEELYNGMLEKAN